MNDVQNRIARTHAARLAAEAQEREAILDALRDRSVSQTEVARLAEISRETVRKLAIEAGIPADARKVRGSAPGLIYAFCDESGTWWPKGHERLLKSGNGTGLKIQIKEGLPSRFAGQELMAMYELEPGTIPDDSPGYVYRLTGGSGRRTTKAVHDEIWDVLPKS